MHCSFNGKFYFLCLLIFKFNIIIIHSDDGTHILNDIQNEGETVQSSTDTINHVDITLNYAGTNTTEMLTNANTCNNTYELLLDNGRCVLKHDVQV
jgi:hypothetical protein